MKNPNNLRTLYQIQDEEWRKLHIEELNNLFQQSDIIRQIRERRLICAGHTDIKIIIKEELIGKKTVKDPTLKMGRQSKKKKNL